LIFISWSKQIPPLFLLGGFFVDLVIDNIKRIKMSDLLETIERTEDGGFVVELRNENGDLLAVGNGDSYESAIEDAKSKL
jgi:hypothetical protein